MSDLNRLMLLAPAVLFGMIIHEVCHGWVAWRLGDPTAKMMGRLTLNPLKHIDPIGTIAIPVILILMRSPFVFGMAKPVPVDPRNFRNPSRDMAITGIAGPAANFLTAAVSGIVLRVLYLLHVGGFPITLFELLVEFSLMLCFFNLIPIPPLDGSRLLYHLLPRRIAASYAQLERYGLFILFGIIIVCDYSGFPLLQLYITPLIRVFSHIFVGRPLV